VDPKTLVRTVYDCLTGCAKASEVILATTVPRLVLLPSNPELAGAEIELVSMPNREAVLREVLRDVRGGFEIMFLDCPPALGLLTVNALVAASSVLIPVQCEYYAMEGLGRLMANIQRVQATFNPDLALEGIVLTMYDARNSLSRQVVEEIRSHFKDKVYQTTIPRNVTLAEAPSYGRPVLLYNAHATGAHAYLELSKEFCKHGKESAR
ncbi:MAG: ParA family protein, partial [Nitrospirales bacterium]